MGSVPTQLRFYHRLNVFQGMGRTPQANRFDDFPRPPHIPSIQSSRTLWEDRRVSWEVPTNADEN